MYPDTPGSHSGATNTSAAAAATVHGVAATLREQVMQILSDGAEMSADQLAAAIGATPFAVRPRVTELKLLDLVEDTGRRVINESGRKAAVWRAVT